jgi:hypothetical protein
VKNYFQVKIAQRSKQGSKLRDSEDQTGHRWHRSLPVTAGDRSYIKVLIGWKIGEKPASDEFWQLKSQTKLQVQERNCSKAAN